ncbi:transposase [Candidatus Nitrotoga sp. 1052]|uniref:transposase n=1 Tax=Candidatus Nitrotoga sp. 1052 TaxID=2886964 RepID=UPI00403D5CA8
MLVVKMLILEHLYNFSDEGIENHVRDRLPFMRFLGLKLEDRNLAPRRPGCSGNGSRPEGRWSVI